MGKELCVFLLKQELRGVVEELPEVFSDGTEADAGEEVDTESGVLYGVLGEHAFQVLLQVLLLELGSELIHAKVLSELLEEDLDEDTTGGCGVLLGELDAGQACPLNDFLVKKVGEHLGSVPELVDLQSVDCDVLLHEEFVELLCVDFVDAAEALCCEAVEAEVGSLLHVALQDHVAQLHLLAFSDVEFEELVTAVLEVDGGHDHQVYRPSQVNQILLCEV